jgi:multiple sugar transport system ATP-binding protein
MSVYDNIGFALKLARVPKPEADKRIRDAAQILELTENLDRKPGQLSGGQRQRVAMGRAIVRQPAAFLMDEPLSNLDAKLRVQMRAEIAKLQRDLGVTTIYVTHDQVEAMTMGDRVAVIKDGYLQQVDTPQNLYDHPTNVFVAAFIGSPSMNLYNAIFTADDHGARVEFGSHELAVPASVLERHPRLAGFSGKPLIVGIRPEDLHDATNHPDHPADQRMRSVVELIEALGSDVLVHFSIDTPPVDSGDPDAVDDLTVDHTPSVARFDPRTQVHIAEEFEIAVTVENMKFFDAETRGAL